MRDKDLLRQIAGCADVQGKMVLEIGPGHGELTQELLKRKPKQLTCIELDESISMPEDIRSRIQLVHGNVLTLLKHYDVQVVVGNIPYGISEPLMKQLLKHLFPSVVLVVGDSFAQDMISGQSKTAIMTRACYTVKKELDISRTAFYPPPKVKSALVVLKRKVVQMDMELIVWRLACLDRKKVLPAVLEATKGVMTKNNVRDLLKDVSAATKEKTISQLTNEEFLHIYNLIVH